MAVFSIAISITFQASKHFWNGVSTDFLYKNVTKDFAVNENFIIYTSPSVVAVAALHHYCGLQVQIKRNKKIWRKYRLSCIFRFILRLVLKLQMAMLIASCWLFFMAYLPPLGRISRVQSRMTLVAFTPVWVNEPRRKNWFCFVEFLWNSVESLIIYVAGIIWHLLVKPSFVVTKVRTWTPSRLWDWNVNQSSEMLQY